MIAGSNRIIKERGDRPKVVEFAPWQLDSSASDQERLFPSFPLQKRRNLGALPRKVSSWDRSIWDDPGKGVARRTTPCDMTEVAQ
jgi:hypothetical protein